MALEGTLHDFALGDPLSAKPLPDPRPSEYDGKRNQFLISDNGGLRFEGKQTEPITSNLPLRAGKGHQFEGGIRNPLIVHWPGVTQAGRKIDTPTACSGGSPGGSGFWAATLFAVPI